MANEQDINKLKREIVKKLDKSMGRIRKEIAVYEKNKAEGKLKTNPTPAPQF